MQCRLISINELTVFGMYSDMSGDGIANARDAFLITSLAQDSKEKAYVVSDTVWFHAITAITLSTYKIAVLVIGYLIIRLGYSLFMKGVSGEFKFSAEFKGAKTHLISASPGLFLILMGTIVLGIGLYKGLEFATSLTGGVECEKCEQSENAANGSRKPVLSPLLPEEVQK